MHYVGIRSSAYAYSKGQDSSWEGNIWSTCMRVLHSFPLRWVWESRRRWLRTTEIRCCCEWSPNGAAPAPVGTTELACTGSINREAQRMEFKPPAHAPRYAPHKDLHDMIDIVTGFLGMGSWKSTRIQSTWALGKYPMNAVSHIELNIVEEWWGGVGLQPTGNHICTGRTSGCAKWHPGRREELLSVRSRRRARVFSARYHTILLAYHPGRRTACCG